MRYKRLEQSTISLAFYQLLDPLLFDCQQMKEHSSRCAIGRFAKQTHQTRTDIFLPIMSSVKLLLDGSILTSFYDKEHYHYATQTLVYLLSRNGNFHKYLETDKLEYFYCDNKANHYCIHLSGSDTILSVFNHSGNYLWGYKFINCTVDRSGTLFPNDRQFLQDSDGAIYLPFKDGDIIKISQDGMMEWQTNVRNCLDNVQSLCKQMENDNSTDDVTKELEISYLENRIVSGIGQPLQLVNDTLLAIGREGIVWLSTTSGIVIDEYKCCEDYSELGMVFTDGAKVLIGARGFIDLKHRQKIILYSPKNCHEMKLATPQGYVAGYCNGKIYLVNKDLNANTDPELLCMNEDFEIQWKYTLKLRDTKILLWNDSGKVIILGGAKENVIMPPLKVEILSEQGNLLSEQFLTDITSIASIETSILADESLVILSTLIMVNEDNFYTGTFSTIAYLY